MPQPQPPTSSLKSSNLLSMFQRKLTHPTPLQLKILIQIQDNIPSLYRPPQDFKLATITIYTEKAVYQGTLKGRNIIKQLAWTAQSMNTLLDCLKGKRENAKVETRFFAVKSSDKNSQAQCSSLSSNPPHTTNYIYQNICQISSGINLPLFSLQLLPSPLHPFLHMKQKFSSLQSTFLSRSLTSKQKQQHLKSQLNQIQAVQKQIIYSSTTQIQLMKKEFIKHVNKEKAKIRKLMGSVPVINPVSGMIENRGMGVGENKGLGRIAEKEHQHQEEEKEERTQSAKKNRQIKKVNRQQYNKPHPQKLQIQDSSSSHQSKYYSQNSSLSSNPHILKREKPHGQKRKHRFTQDNDSSEQDNHQGQGQQNDQGKTFLELQREKMERQKKMNNGKNEEEGDVWEDLVI